VVLHDVPEVEVQLGSVSVSYIFLSLSLSGVHCAVVAQPNWGIQSVVHNLVGSMVHLQGMPEG